MASKNLSEVGEHIEGSIPVDAQPVGYLRILKQEEFEQIDYPVYEGKF